MSAVCRFPRLDPEAHEERRKHDEYVGLQEGHKELEKIDADNKRDRPDSDKIGSEDEYHPEKGNDDDVSTQHIGEETHAEREGRPSAPGRS